MSEDNIIDITPEEAVEEPPRSQASTAARVLLVLAILLFLATSAALGYAWLEWKRAAADLDNLHSSLLTMRQQGDELDRQIDASRQTIAEQQQHIELQRKRLEEASQQLEAQQEQADALEQQVATTTRQQQESGQALQEVVQVTRAQVSATPAPWIAAHAAHLLEIADQQLGLFHDPASALSTMRYARDTLEDVRFDRIREQLDLEIAVLEAYQQPDAIRLLQQVNQLQRLVRSLVLRPVVYARDTSETRQDNTPVDNENSLERTAAAGLEKLRSLVTITHHSEDRRPRITHLQESLIRQELQLALDNARIALQRRDAEQFRDALLLTQALFSHYFETNDQHSTAFSTDLENLLAVDIQPPLPKTGQALASLMQLLDEEQQ